jgi:hypothetical protein
MKTTGWLGCLQLMTALLSLAGPAAADITSVSVNPGMQGLALGRQAPVTLTWQAVRDETNCMGTVTSAQVEIRAGQATGPLLRVLPRRLSRFAACNSTVPSRTFSFVDTLMIPSSVSEQALQLGSDRLVLVRSFSDGLSGSAASATLALRSPAAAGLAITGLRLQLADGGAERVVEQGQPVAARAELYYTGNGILRGRWEIAEPPGTAGVPLFRPLRQVQQLLPPGGQASLTAPPLPSRAPGLYLLRFRPDDNRQPERLPLLRYQVLAATQTGPGFVDIILAVPAAGAVLAPTTSFRWQPVSGASAYRLRLFRSVDATLPRLDGSAAPARDNVGELVAGQWLPGSDNTATLGPLLWEKLDQPGRYWWQVEALDADGQSLGRSDLREITRP